MSCVFIKSGPRGKVFFSKNTSIGLKKLCMDELHMKKIDHDALYLGNLLFKPDNGRARHQFLEQKVDNLALGRGRPYLGWVEQRIFDWLFKVLQFMLCNLISCQETLVTSSMQLRESCGGMFQWRKTAIESRYVVVSLHLHHEIMLHDTYLTSRTYLNHPFSYFPRNSPSLHPHQFATNSFF